MNTTKQVPDYHQIQNGVTWIGGTTHQLQRQHIPGYAGHVHGLFAENIYGKNFARVTAQCLNSRNPTGIDYDKDQKYRSSYKNQFEQPDGRRTKFINTAESVLGKLEAAEKEINSSIQQTYSKQPKNIEQISPIDRLPVVGYMGHRPVYRQPIKQVKPIDQPTQVSLPEKQVLEQMLQTGTLNQQRFSELTKQEPVVGYGGFLKGVKAENQYGQSYRDLAKNSIRK